MESSESHSVTPLHKKGPRNLLNNYRPISILPVVISKVFEKVLYEQLYDYLVANNLLSHHQFGFRQFSLDSICPFRQHK
jgi:hypothetical protein